MKEMIQKMVRLAHLKLPPEELNRFSAKAKHILEYIEKLKEVDTTKIEPTSHAIEITNAFREDVVEKFGSTAKILRNAPSQYQNLFEVPRVIDEN